MCSLKVKWNCMIMIGFIKRIKLNWIIKNELSPV